MWGGAGGEGEGLKCWGRMGVEMGNMIRSASETGQTGPSLVLVMVRGCSLLDKDYWTLRAPGIDSLRNV